eukprot:NODE_19031_length_863_cov_4.479620.p2 GENE.NODE_19031_length_863_cov_4.479620~~NODE_19031_length_863_cov_4.479620.p2  ORF type:complete len:69 (-),score=19.09 NODE_19031_length_863_cov_4.479620:485-691(-)
MYTAICQPRLKPHAALQAMTMPELGLSRRVMKFSRPSPPDSCAMYDDTVPHCCSSNARPWGLVAGTVS